MTGAILTCWHISNVLAIFQRRERSSRQLDRYLSLEFKRVWNWRQRLKILESQGDESEERSPRCPCMYSERARGPRAESRWPSTWKRSSENAKSQKKTGKDQSEGERCGRCSRKVKEMTPGNHWIGRSLVAWRELEESVVGGSYCTARLHRTCNRYTIPTHGNWEYVSRLT